MVQIYKSGGRRKSGKSANKRYADVQFDKLDAHGQGVASQHQPVVFAPGVLPGETWRVEVSKSHNHYWQAKAVKALQTSDKRLAPFCQYFEHCGGCQTQYLSAASMLQYKQQALDEKLRKDLKLASLPWQAAIDCDSQGYRRKARLSVDARDKHQMKLGFKGKQSNRVLNIDQCPVLLPSLQALISPLQSLLRRLTAPMSLGHISLLAADNVTSVAVRQLKTLSNKDKALWKDFANAHQVQVWIESTPEQFERLAGPKQVATYSPAVGVNLEVSQSDFIQVNPDINQRMVRQALDWLAVTADDVVADLFSGLGNFSIPMAKVAKQVYALEVVTKMVQRANHNGQANGVSNLQSDVVDLQSSPLSFAQNPNKVLLDPARAGALAAVKQVAKLSPELVLYVSCNPATFSRDAAVLVEQGYELNKIGLMDMFPFTTHTELMALFSAP